MIQGVCSLASYSVVAGAACWRRASVTVCFRCIYPSPRRIPHEINVLGLFCLSKRCQALSSIKELICTPETRPTPTFFSPLFLACLLFVRCWVFASPGAVAFRPAPAGEQGDPSHGRPVPADEEGGARPLPEAGALAPEGRRHRPPRPVPGGELKGEAPAGDRQYAHPGGV